jgi:7-cyano-7-deazaguanine synthase
MSIVLLVSGGIDSSLMAILAKEEGVTQYPLFVDYGQLCRDKELNACRSVFAARDLPEPRVMNLSGFGATISSGLTDKSKDIFADAFLPGRNMLLLLAGYAYAYEKGADKVAIGLLNEETHLFPDQTKMFVHEAEGMLSLCTGRAISIVAPLMHLSKPDVLRLARKYGLTKTYSCHSGSDDPCGLCVSCKELFAARRKGA